MACNDHEKDKIGFLNAYECIFPSFLLSFHATFMFYDKQRVKLPPSETNFVFFFCVFSFFFPVLCMRAHETTNDKRKKLKNTEFS